MILRGCPTFWRSHGTGPWKIEGAEGPLRERRASHGGVSCRVRRQFGQPYTKGCRVCASYRRHGHQGGLRGGNHQHSSELSESRPRGNKHEMDRAIACDIYRQSSSSVRNCAPRASSVPPVPPVPWYQLVPTVPYRRYHGTVGTVPRYLRYRR
jgi:hypothetical protein